MATHIDNSKNMSTTDVKNALINTFKRSAEKSVQDAGYDKTILATIQYCSDATIGQYKIKYQNGYFTAYSRDTNTIYTNQSSVYVLVPGNNMNNRMFITGLATNDNAQKAYANNLEMDQAYMKDSINLITRVSNDINMLSYWNAPNTYTRVLYQYGADSNLITLSNQTYTYIKNSGGALRFGASFRTTFTDDRKVSGDYGLRLRIRYTNNIMKDYDINTFNMIGSPFNFTTFVPQYNYWDIDINNFERIESITEYMTGFPVGTPPADINYRDIFIKDLSIYTATKLYDTNNDKYKVEIIAPEGKIFTTQDTDNDTLSFIGKLKVDGNYVNDNSGQNLQIYWGKEDVSINSRTNPKYNSVLGEGWYCLNTANKETYTAETIDQLKNIDVYTITSEELASSTTAFVWNSTDNIVVKKKMCPGKTTKLKCAIVYQNNTFTQEIEIINEDGMYLILKADNDIVEFYNGTGATTITAGLFKDDGGNAPTSVTLTSTPYDITYQWEEIDSLNIHKTLPYFIPDDILNTFLQWDEESDNETLDDATVQTYLDANPLAEECKERYNYYDEKYNEYVEAGQTEDGTTEGIYMARCRIRKNSLLEKRETEIYSLYKANAKNEVGFFILGPSDVTAEYSGNVHDYTTAKISTTTHYWYDTVEYPTYQTKQNTLYNLRIGKIGDYSDYKVTAFITRDGITQSIETKTIRISNISGASLNYHLEITNGVQTFLYSVGGKAPTSVSADGAYAIAPLTFRLYNQSGDLLYDSVNPDSELNQTNITQLNPIWTWSDASYSLLTTKYKGSTNCSVPADDITKLKLSNAGSFVYDLAQDFDVNKKNNSNVQLQVYYDGQTVYAETSFNFIKQGDLGTNGTDLYLYIKDPSYEKYRNGVLSASDWSKFDDFDGDTITVDTFTPEERHLKDTYLFATKCYDNSKAQIDDLTSAHYVNLAFANSGTAVTPPREGGIAIHGENTATLKGYWSENGHAELVANDESSKWSDREQGLDACTLPDGTKIYTVPPFYISSSGVGSSVTLKIDNVNMDPPFGYKPTTIHNFVVDGKTYDKISNDVVKLEARHEIAAQIDPVTNEPIERVAYGYYQIPYFYFSYGSETPSDLDPARHIVLVGGYDEVIYDDAGYNPEYNKQHPFRLYLFDENNNDITRDFLAALDSGRAEIQWSCSPGFTLLSPTGQETYTTPLNYSDIASDIQLFDTYCIYNGNTYHCIVDYNKGETITVPDGNGGTATTYNPGDFVTPYWEKVDLLRLKYQEKILVPNVGYNSLVSSNLFNSWISVYVHWLKSNSQNYTAECLIPINVICDRYGSEEINGWDGKKTKVGDAYIIANKVAAGRKYDDNSFVGVTIGESFYAENPTRENEIGVFGYGRTDRDDPTTWQRTFFMDAESGKLILGPSGGAQIFLNPKTPEEGSGAEYWSRIAGWYISSNYFYKPINEGSNPLDFDDLSQRNGENAMDVKLATLMDGSAGMYVPWQKDAEDDDVFIWASGQGVTYRNINQQVRDFKNSAVRFAVTYGGHLYCKEADVTGTIKAESGWFGTGTNQIKVAYTKDDVNYILYNDNFWVKDTSGQDDQVAVYVKGRIMAKSGQFGKIGENKDGTSSETVFIAYNWYPWHYPAYREPWNSTYFYLDRSQGMTTFYPLYHKNFNITKDGDVTVNGRIYAQAGRIGAWRITCGELDDRLPSGCISDCYDTIILKPSTSPSDDSYIQVGHMILRGEGSITGYGEKQDGTLDTNNRLWYITRDGEAHFNNIGSTYKGASYVTSTGTTLNSSGLTMASGETITAGSATFTSGVTFQNGISLTSGDIVAGSNRFGSSGATIFSMTFNNSGINLANRTLSGGSLDPNLTIDGKTLSTYINDLIDAKLANKHYITNVVLQGKTKANIPDTGFVGQSLSITRD